MMDSSIPAVTTLSAEDQYLIGCADSINATEFFDTHATKSTIEETKKAIFLQKTLD